MDRKEAIELIEKFLAASMSGAKSMDRSQRAEQLAKRMHREWGVGNIQCNNGVLLFLTVSSNILPGVPLQPTFFVDFTCFTS